ncbi:MAG: hypothetical protein JO276_05695 [Sphingomonadaceae bacterium]|nr:hypothetical protein [Sphingomonadaceae bacterium]
MRARRTVLAALLVLAGCVFDTLYDRTLVGPYRLLAIDEMESMSIVWDIPGGGEVGDGLPGPTVFAAGYDDRFVVAAVHPELCPPFAKGCTGHGMNRSVTQYWYVIRQPDEWQHHPARGIRGPFTQAQFDAEKGRLHLPEFGIRFPELE